MSINIAGSSARAEAQESFVALLCHPLLTARTEPALFRQALRHRDRLSDWAARLGYRLVYAGTAVRLHRDPCGPQLTAAPPPMDPPPRRELVLRALVAAACEDVGGSATLQELSDEVRALSVGAGANVTPYDSDRRVERQALVRALGYLAELGVVYRRTTDEVLLKQWEDDGAGIGGGYEINADALLQFTDPHTVGLALGHPAQRPDVDLLLGDANKSFATAPQTDVGDAEEVDQTRLHTRGQRMLRLLVEDTALLYADLHPVDAEYARAQRSWLAGQAVEMTGGGVETRMEGMLLLLADDRPTNAEATPTFPAATARSWFTLKLLDATIRAGSPPDESGRLHRTSAEIDAIVAELHVQHEGALTVELKESPARVRAAAQGLLTGLGLLRVTHTDGWIVLPTSGRFRDPTAVFELLKDEDNR